MSSQPAPTAPPHPPSIGFNLAGIAVLALLLAVGAAYLLDEIGRTARTPTPSLEDGSPIVQTISGRELTIPTAWFRYGEQIREGFTNQIDLTLIFAPDGVTPLPVQVMLLPRSRARTSSTLLDAVYLHQFGDETLAGISGLVGKPLGAAAGYEGERVWYDPLSANPFVAKCMAPIEPGAPEQCVRTVYLPSGIAAVYAFDATALQSWRQFDGQMQLWLEKIGAW
ncbi:hypothetical protein [Devosia sp. LC5]|uniref:hypothetical protein n=1 Tax=Devosia sp. LC5 TaxID=1502724 RepID=UPI001267ED67|nr:hypothetical protein [Devosia sp. LC5]